MTAEFGATNPSAPDLAGLVDAGKDGAVLRVHVQPGARGEGIAGVHGNALKVRVRAPATSGRANDAVLSPALRDACPMPVWKPIEALAVGLIVRFSHS